MRHLLVAFLCVFAGGCSETTPTQAPLGNEAGTADANEAGTADANQAETTVPNQSETAPPAASPVGRFTIVHSPHTQRDTILLDTATGKTWSQYERTNEGNSAAWDPMPIDPSTHSN